MVLLPVMKSTNVFKPNCSVIPCTGRSVKDDRPLVGRAQKRPYSPKSFGWMRGDCLFTGSVLWLE